MSAQSLRQIAKIETEARTASGQGDSALEASLALLRRDGVLSLNAGEYSVEDLERIAATAVEIGGRVVVSNLISRPASDVARIARAGAGRLSIADLHLI